MLIIFSSFHLDIENFTPTFPKGVGGTLAAISLIYISFFGYQLIANNSDEIIQPEITVPKAMKLSMIISGVAYLLIAIVSVCTVSWDQLGSSKAPLVAVANKSFGGYGWLIISFGGVLASLSALGSTIVSQSRQIYVMGKHRFFPDFLGSLDEKTKTPKFALIAGGALIAIILLFADVEFIAKSANFCLLVSLLPVSIALRKIYLKEPSKRPERIWKQFLPELALLANLALLFTLDIVSLAFGQQLALAGAAVYFFYSRKREKRSRGGVNITFEKEKGIQLFTGRKILVPMANPKTQQALFKLSQALLSKKGGEIHVLSVKDVPENVDFYEALSDAGETLEVIKRSVELAKERNTTIKPVIRASRNIAMGIIEAAEEENCDLIMMGYASKRQDGKLNVMDKVLKFSSRDMAFLKVRSEDFSFHPKKIGVCIRGTANLDLMLILATAIAEECKGTITLLHFLQEDYDKKHKEKADKLIIEAIQKLNSLALYNVQLKASLEPQQDLVKLSENFDLMVIGTTMLQVTEKTIATSNSINLAEHAHCSVLLVREVPGYKKLMNRL